MWFENVWHGPLKEEKYFINSQKTLFEPPNKWAANPGFRINGFSSGLIWDFFYLNMEWKLYCTNFFLVCSNRGFMGAYSVERKYIFLFQALPAILAILFLFISLNNNLRPRVFEVSRLIIP